MRTVVRKRKVGPNRQAVRRIEVRNASQIRPTKQMVGIHYTNAAARSRPRA